jgi:hypothetical protein
VDALLGAVQRLALLDVGHVAEEVVVAACGDGTTSADFVASGSAKLRSPVSGVTVIRLLCFRYPYKNVLKYRTRENVGGISTLVVNTRQSNTVATYQYW